MIDELNKAISDYQAKWQALVAVRHDRTFFEGLKPTAIGWKVTDRAEYDKIVAELHDQADLIINTWMNDRWIAKIHLKGIKLVNDIQIVKIMQRRPGSTDAVGLDHVDFYTPSVQAQNEKILTAESDLKWTKESNDVIEGYDWLSVWFDETEAKIKSDTILDIIQAELEALNQEIIGA